MVIRARWQVIINSDAFQKREKANEDYAIKLREKEKLLELKKKLADQQQHLKKLEDSMWALQHLNPQINIQQQYANVIP
jgi:hypothetical protein